MGDYTRKASESEYAEALAAVKGQSEAHGLEWTEALRLFIMNQAEVISALQAENRMLYRVLHGGNDEVN